MLSMKQASEYMGASRNTLRRWEAEGKIKSVRTAGGHRRFRKEDLAWVSKAPPSEDRYVIGYCRVSSAGQKEDLKRQVEHVSLYCTARGYNFKIVTDIGSGLNYNKKGLNELISLIMSKQVSKIVINYKDRLVRYGYELLEQVCAFNHTEIEIVNLTEDKTYEEELVEDVLSIITVFSAKLYGSRSHKNKEVVSKSKDLFQ